MITFPCPCCDGTVQLAALYDAVRVWYPYRCDTCHQDGQVANELFFSLGEARMQRMIEFKLRDGCRR